MDLEQFIGTLSEEERQRHKELIEECRLRREETRKICRQVCDWPLSSNAQHILKSGCCSIS